MRTMVQRSHYSKYSARIVSIVLSTTFVTYGLGGLARRAARTHVLLDLVILSVNFRRFGRRRRPDPDASNGEVCCISAPRAQAATCIGTILYDYWEMTAWNYSVA